ncbi:MAG TPA: 2-oxoglutarate dehydrogenase, E2 component, dihydrolipoamide succinyltransferase [Kineosporiaceae bacterium]|jgi:2-oxoglutarate dehydrogenase E2 component (dihydrolipoamide succinyltransferase)|nr:2-oxoglutarate dehydrogenase, E2 component, dihydrolipoamide succinyltransferase [Kineosporiaceae bacterium]
MSDSVQMPALGESVTEGTVTRWLKQVGEHVDVDEPLLEVSTDKVDTEIPSPVAGVLQEILVSEDETVAVGTALARIGDGEGGGEQPQQEQPRTEPAADRVQAESTVPTPDVDAPPVRPSSTEVEQPAERPHPTAEPAGDGGERVQMPALGESVTEGTVTRWLKQEGDSVEVDEPLLEVSTDKVDTEIPSPVAGVVRKILVGEDETVAVGADLVVVGPAGGAAPAAAQSPQQQSQPAAQPSQPAPQQSQQQAPPPPAPPAPRPAPASAAPAPAPAPQRAASPSGDTAPASGSGGSAPSQDGSGYAEYPAANPAPAPSGEQSPAQAQAAQALRSPEAPAAGTDGDGAGGQGADPSVYVTPLVRRLATEHGVDLAGVTGTGVGGRVRKQDVLDAAKAKQQAAAAPAPAAAPAAPAAAASRPAPAVSALRGTTVKMSRLRKVVAQRMVESLQVSAQLTTVVEVDVTRIARLRARAKGEFEAREGVKLSFLPFFAVAAVEALKQYPVVNASIDGDQVVYHGEENLGIAVDTERGLVVPVVRNAGDLNIAGVARKIADLADRTRNNKITPDDLGGGTFTLTNTGSRGALFDTPIINQPQVAILGTGAVVKRPVVVPGADGEETIAIRSMVYLALTYDHRIVDGADAARFLVAVKQRLEEGAFEADLGL